VYIPEAFRQDSPALLHAFVRRHSFATLVTLAADAAGTITPFAGHLPFLLDAGRGPNGVLRAHMARANPQWRHFRPEQEVLVIFTGPHTFVSSAWYEQPEEMVPTWNFTAVHVSGKPRIVTEERAVLELLRDLMAIYQPESAPPPVDPPDERLRSRVRGIVAFEVEVTRWEGKFKLSQNRTVEDQRRVREALAQRGTPEDLAVAALMADLAQEAGEVG
jgi:transcriptional regulator